MKSFITLLVPLVFTVAGCAYDPIAYTGLDDEPDRGIEANLDRVLDRYCPLDEKSKTGEWRLWRAHVLIGVIARYGAARTEDYSDDKPGDAGRILTRTTIALAALDDAYKELSRPSRFYAVKRADLILSTLDLAAAAAKPTTRTVIGFIRTPSTSTAGELIRNAFENRMYKDAYAEDCNRFNKSAADKPGPADWMRSNEELDAQCKRLGALSKTAPACSLKNVPMTKTATGSGNS